MDPSQSSAEPSQQETSASRVPGVRPWWVVGTTPRGKSREYVPHMLLAEHYKNVKEAVAFGQLLQMLGDLTYDEYVQYRLELLYVLAEHPC